MPSRARPNHRLGERLAQLRKTAGYSQRALARELGLTHRTISYYELEADRAPSDFLVSVARVLGVSVDHILGLDDDDEKRLFVRNRRLKNRIREVEHLPRRAQNALIEFIDALLVKYSGGDNGG